MRITDVANVEELQVLDVMLEIDDVLLCRARI